MSFKLNYQLDSHINNVILNSICYLIELKSWDIYNFMEIVLLDVYFKILNSVHLFEISLTIYAYVYVCVCIWHIYTHIYQISPSVVPDSLRPHELQNARPPCQSPTPGVHSDSHPSSQ